jgi:hypothetical protein
MSLLQTKRDIAEGTYLNWCMFNPAGCYPGVDDIRNNLRTMLDALGEELKSR